MECIDYYTNTLCVFNSERVCEGNVEKCAGGKSAMCCTILARKQQGLSAPFFVWDFVVFAHKYTKTGERGISDSEARVKDLIVWKRQQLLSALIKV